MRRGSKYEPLKDYLMRQCTPRLALTIGEIEALLGFELCESAGTHAWWSNTKDATGRAQRHAWGDAGYRAYLLPARDAVEFVRAAGETSCAPSIRKRSGARHGPEFTKKAPLARGSNESAF